MRCPKTGCGGELIDGVCKSCAEAQSAGGALASSIQERTAKTGASLVAEPLTVSQTSLPTAQLGNTVAKEAQLENSEIADAKQNAATDNLSAGQRSAELKLQKVSARLKKIDGKEALMQASEALKTVVPDKFESWRAQADLWLAAIRQLQTRELNPDDSVLLMGIPLIERNLRDAAEEALRQCAHFAPTFEQRVAFIDEANNIRNMSWF